jgi:hypothetical protein
MTTALMIGPKFPKNLVGSIRMTETELVGEPPDRIGGYLRANLLDEYSAPAPCFRRLRIKDAVPGSSIVELFKEY